MTNIIIYSDFDGTVTNKAGRDTVFSVFYQSLFIGYQPGINQNYRDATLNDSDIVQSLFEAKFGKYDEHFNYSQIDVDFLISPQAVAFFHEVLNNKNVSVYLVTKNRFDYIEELFKYQGFSQKEREQLKIMDSGFKFIDVNNALQLQKENASHLYILDDSSADYYDMLRAAKINNYQENQIYGGIKKPGSFEWDQYLNEIKEFSSLDVTLSEDLSLANKTSTVTNEFFSVSEKNNDQKRQQCAASALAKINHAIKALEDKIGQVDHHSWSRAFLKAKELLEQLKQARELYVININTQGCNLEEAGKQFKIKCQMEIDNAKPILEQDLQWGDYLSNLLKAFFNAVVLQVTANPDALFTLVRSRSIKAVEEIESELCDDSFFLSY